MSRKTLSAPMRYLKSKGLISRGWLTLDFGCGRGDDARALQIHGYDPHFTPWAQWVFKEKWDVITCNYVLNVVDEAEGLQIIKQLNSMLAPTGRAYITVRRDVKKDGLTSRGTYQRNVVLPLPVVTQNSNFCIYLLTSGDYSDILGA